MAARIIKKSVRMSSDEHQKIEEVSKGLGFSTFSDYARAQLKITAAQATKTLANQAANKQNIEVLRLLRSIANNANQIAHALHIIKKSADKSAYDFTAFDEIVQETRQLQADIMAVLK